MGSTLKTAIAAAARARVPLTAALALLLVAFLGIGAPAASAAPPTLTINAATNVETTKAHLSGEVSVPADGNGSYWCLEYTEEGQSTWSSFCYAGYVSPGESVPVEADLSGLKASTPYEVRLAAIDNVEFFEGSEALSAEPNPTFETDPAPTAPALELPAPTASYTSAGPLQGTLDPEGGNEEASGAIIPIHWLIEVSQTGDPGTWTEVSSGDISEGPAKESNPITVPGTAAQASSLTPATTYHYRLRATYAGQEKTTPDATFTTLAVTPPAVTGEDASSVTATSAHFSGTVEVTNADPAFDASCHFDYVSDAKFTASEWAEASQVPCDHDPVKGSESQPVTVSADPTLIPNTTYHLRLVATNAGGAVTTLADHIFTTPAIKPDIARGTLWGPTQTSIQLNAAVNPHNDVLTDCHFEYGVGGTLDQSAPCEAQIPGDPYSPPSGEGFTTVSARISGLDPATKYHFRLVATNSTGTSEGDVRSFTTPEEAAAEECASLPGCRHYEKVSPDDKGNGDVVGDGRTNIASEDGNAISFNSRASFGDTIGSGVSGQTTYVARRSPAGWVTHSATPRPAPDAYQTFLASTYVQIFSEDLRRAYVSAYDLPESSDDIPYRRNLYIEDTETRALRAVTSAPVEAPPLVVEYAPGAAFGMAWALSDDARHVAVTSPTRFLAEVTNGQPNVYQWDDGTLSLAGTLPDGSLPAGGSRISNNTNEWMYRRTMSVDGRRLLFTSPVDFSAPEQLYQRIDGNRTVWVSQPEGSDQSDPQGVELLAATPDGHTVFFRTDSPLLDADTSLGSDIYRWRDSADPANDSNLTLITNDGAQVSSDLVGISDDGERVYYRTTGANLKVWDHGDMRLISDSVDSGSSGGLAVTGRPGAARVSPDGRYLAFLTNGTLDTVHGLTGQVTNRHAEMYLYSLDDDSLRCISCPSGPATADVLVTAKDDKGVVTTGEPQVQNYGIRPRFLSDDGEVFFSTAGALVAQDGNGTFDAYEYDAKAGQLTLLSSGTGAHPTAFVDASISGDDVFMVTRRQLVPGDRDTLVDLYDARVGPAPPGEPQAAPACEGDGCQRSPSRAPDDLQTGTSLTGGGNPKANRGRRGRCSRTQRKVRRNGEVRCVKHKRTANTHRRAGR